MPKFKILFAVFSLAFLAASCNRQPAENSAATSAPQTGQDPATEPAEEMILNAANPDPASEPAASQPKTVTVSMTASGFEPDNLTVKVGDVVKFVNNDSQTHWPASDPHPIHTDYSGLDPRQGLAPDADWSFTFTQAGSWRLHDHLVPTRRANIMVK